MKEQQTWRMLLGTLIEEPRHKQQIAAELGVNPLTLTRWVKNKATPRLEILHRLLSILPEQRALLLPLIVQEFPEFSSSILNGDGETLAEEIPSAFYSEVLDMLSSLPQEQAVWPTCKLILQHACERLDPYHRSVAVLITLCVPPSKGNKVRSLRSAMGVGVAAWGGNVENQSSFLGSDTIPGQVVSESRPITIQNYLEPRLVGPESRAGIVSSCTYPIMRAGQTAGTFGATNSLPDYFSPARQALIQEYAKLVSILFAPNMFYTLQDIELLTMPSPVVQLPYIETLQTRIRQIMTASMRNGEALTYLQAEQLAWQQLEEELLQVALLKERKERLDGSSPHTG